MTISAEQQTALERPATQTVFFAEFAFQSATLYLCSLNINIEWGGKTWHGAGALGAISQIEETDGLESKPLNFSLNVADTSMLALAVGPVEQYRGRSVKLYRCPLNENFQLVGTPEICWRGVMDQVSVGVEGEEGKINLKCETAAFGLKRGPALRMNAAQQKQKHPTDTGFDYLPDLIANQQNWLSAKFRRI